ncbi:UPF0545 protein C22orf39 homolog [Aethina tumida]|uniref:UPF0545 protein C22orf39 homolog n=1 Tax=Aethina tumida TaxID=116153 RepID=UPI00096B3D6C|nr:UPF0545 protein C22orf39 homolog [Aethina tumida]
MVPSENSKETPQDSKADTNRTALKDEWMIRKCSVYEDEYQDCVSIKARFNQYFIFGEAQDCSQWKIDANNCNKYLEKNDLKAGQEVIDSEKRRRLQRLVPHYQNDVWENRKTPPEDWNKPLPEHLQKEYEFTYLNLKSKEMKGEIPPTFDPPFNGFSCTIM